MSKLRPNGPLSKGGVPTSLGDLHPFGGGYMWHVSRKLLFTVILGWFATLAWIIVGIVALARLVFH